MEGRVFKICLKKVNDNTSSKGFMKLLSLSNGSTIGLRELGLFGHIYV